MRRPKNGDEFLIRDTRIRDVCRRFRVTALLGCVLGIGCGGASSPTAPTSAASPPVQGLFLSTSSGRAERVFFPPRGEYSEIRYTWCYSINLARDVVNRSVTIRRVENTVLGPSGSVYSTSTSSFLTGNSFISTGSIGAFGCPDAYNDPDVAPPVATTYRMQIDYVFDDGMPPGIFSAVAGGVIESRVPPPPTTPQMTALTITHDIPGPQLIIRNRTPATFTAIGEGGRSPVRVSVAYQRIRAARLEPEPDVHVGHQHQWCPSVPRRLYPHCLRAQCRWPRARGQ